MSPTGLTKRLAGFVQRSKGCWRRFLPAPFRSWAVVLTDAAAIGAGKTRRVGGRKYNRNACLGFYRRKHGGTPASTEIVVDNALAGWPAFVFALRLFRDLVLARVLFHELGHHLDAAIGAAAPTGEAAAEEWNRRLGRSYFRRRYWWLRPFAVVFRPIGWMRRRSLKRKAA